MSMLDTFLEWIGLGPREAPRILFICKKNENYGFVCYTKKTSGLFNSTRFIVQSLQSKGVNAKIIEVDDNNDIDREVHKFKPHVVVIEAFWVVPEKFDVLKKLHPHVKWFCHLHSDIPFLALEGIAMEWAFAYLTKGVKLIANSVDLYVSLRSILETKDIFYLPNVYLSKPREPRFIEFPDAVQEKQAIDIACFGAVRPLKNQLLQAIAAIEFAKTMEKPLRFYINATRIETGGQPVLKNLRSLFANTENADLIEMPWMEPEEFITILNQQMDIGMQVSLTETFNVVTADYITAGLPFVCSPIISWVSSRNMAAVDSVIDIVSTMQRVWQNARLVKRNQNLLLDFAREAGDDWFEFVKRQFRHC